MGCMSQRSIELYGLGRVARKILAYLTSLRQATKPLLEEEKRTGVIVDYISWPRFFQFNPFHIQGETYMAKMHWALACLLLFVTAAAAQEHYTEGPVWRVTLVRVKPTQMDAYLTSLRQATKPLLVDEKLTGA